MNSLNVAVIPARLGSQRLKKKNLELFGEVTLIEHAIRRCKEANVFDDIYVNSESSVFEEFAEREGVKFHHRPTELGSNSATSEDFIFEFLERVECRSVFQIHSITPLLSSKEIATFSSYCENNSHLDTVLSCIDDQIEVAFENCPINFSFGEKTNSQDLKAVQRITWAASKWSREKFLEEKNRGGIGTYSGTVGFYSVGPFSGLAIKTAYDLKIANALREALSD